MSRIRVRSKAGAPFQFSTSLRIPTDWIEAECSERELRALRIHRWIECASSTGQPFGHGAASAAWVCVRARQRIHASDCDPTMQDLLTGLPPGVDRVVYVSSAELASLEREPRLWVRAHDHARMPQTVFVRLRARVGHVERLRCDFSQAFVAFELPFADFSELRFDTLMCMELLEPDSLPPLVRVRVRSLRSTPHASFGLLHSPGQWTEMTLYPGELMLLEKLGNFEYRTLPTEPAAMRRRPEPLPTGALPNEVVHEEPKPTTAGAPEISPLENATTFQAAEGDEGALLASILRWAQRADARARSRERGGLTLDEITTAVFGSPCARARSRPFEMRVAVELRRLGWEHLPQCRRGASRVRPYMSTGIGLP